MNELKNKEQDLNIVNEKEYLDMTNHLKDLYDKKEKELEIIKEENINLKKTIMSCYGSVRLLDMQINNLLLEDVFPVVIESLRSFLSDFVDREILKVEENY